MSAMASEKKSAPRLFFLYAHPCGDVLVKRGTIGTRELSGLRAGLAAGKTPSAGPKLFRKAFARLSAFARERKRKITPALVREYFTERHNPVVRKSRKPDVVVSRCLITPCRIVSVNGNSALADSPRGKKKINVSYAKGLRKGDLVSTHYWVACEKIPGKTFHRLWGEF